MKIINGLIGINIHRLEGWNFISADGWKGRRSDVESWFTIITLRTWTSDSGEARANIRGMER